MNFPNELKYTADHEWVRINGNEAVKTVSDLMMPMTGEVLEVNAELEDAPELVNEDPYGKGWIIKVAIANPAEADELLDAAGYQEKIGK